MPLDCSEIDCNALIWLHQKAHSEVNLEKNEGSDKGRTTASSCNPCMLELRAFPMKNSLKYKIGDSKIKRIRNLVTKGCHSHLKQCLTLFSVQKRKHIFVNVPSAFNL